MIFVKYVLQSLKRTKKHNLSEQNVVILYVMNALNNFLKINSIRNVQYADKKIGFIKYKIFDYE